MDFWEKTIERANKPTFIVTDNQSTILGFVNGGLERENDPVYTAELYALYLLKNYHGHGYGEVLFRTIVREFLEQNYTAMLLWVLSTNPSRGFYEKMGGQYLKTKAIDIGGETLEEVAYGWTDLPNLFR